MRISLTAISVMLLSFLTHGIEHKKVALQFHTNFDRYESTTEAGIRYYPFRRTGFDLSFGLSHDLPLHRKAYSDISYDRFPTNNLSERYYHFSIGSIYEIHSRRNLIISIFAKGDFSIGNREVYEFYTNSLLYGYNEISVEYTVFQPSVVIGLESSFYFSERFCIYSDFGLSASYIPATRYIDSNNSSFSYQNASIPLSRNSDSGITVRLRGLGTGLRYFF